MTEYKRLTAREAAEKLLTYKNPVVLMHVRPDGDTVGSASALIKILRRLGIEAEYASADTVSRRLSFLLEGEKQAESLDGRELIAIDVASPAQLGSLANYKDNVSLTIDHHKVNTPFSDNYTVPDASSAGEVLFSVLCELIDMGKCSLDSELAYPIYTSVSSDTGGFIFSSVTPDTHRLAARLIETGIDFADINHRLFNSKSKEQLKAEGFIASRLMTEADGRIAYATVSIEERCSLGLSPSDFETAIDVVRSLLLSEVAVLVRENDDGSVKASIRSTGANVAEIAAEFGGGGHVRAAGCTLPAKSAEEGARMIIEKIKKAIS